MWCIHQEYTPLFLRNRFRVTFNMHREAAPGVDYRGQAILDGLEGSGGLATGEVAAAVQKDHVGVRRDVPDTGGGDIAGEHPGAPASRKREPGRVRA